MYNSLLLSTDGGIIGNKQQSEPAECAVIAIGLGGTGIDCLRALKAKVYDRIRPDNGIRPDNVNSSITQYSHIKFFAVDADKKSADLDGTKNEYFDISFSNTGGLTKYFNALKNQNNNNGPYREWLQFGRFQAGAVKDGAAGIRQIGRFLLIQKAQQFVSQLKTLVTQAKTGLNAGARVYVHVFSGMGGGTGSGTFLDACYLIRKSLDELGVADHRVMGYFFLPDINLSIGSLAPEVKKYITSNGYAAMQELDYCMSFQRNGDKWRQLYPGVGEVISNEQPVDFCHLISARSISGEFKDDAYKYSMSVVTDYVMDFLIKPQDENTYGLNSHFSNINAIKAELTKTDGSSYDYLALGATCASVPFKWIMTYLVSHFFINFDTLLKKTPSKKEIDSFVKKVGLTQDAIEQKIKQGCIFTFSRYNGNPSMVKDGTCRETPEDYYARLVADIKGQLAKNLKDLSDSVGYSYTDLSSGEHNQAVMAKVVNEIRDKMVDPEYGPAYAALLVDGAAGEDLLSCIKQIKGWAEGMLSHDDYQLKDGTPIRDAYMSKRDAFYNKKPSVMSKAKSLVQGISPYDDYINALQTHEERKAKVELYEAIIILMDNLKEHLEDLKKEFIVPFEEMLKDLCKTFDLNRNTLNLWINTDKKNSYEEDLVSMKDLIPWLNQELKSLSKEISLSRMRELLKDSLLENDEAWRQKGDNELLSYLVRHFFIQKFKEWSEKTLTQFLQYKYNTINPTQLAKDVESDLKNKANESEPLFWADANYTASLGSTSTIGYVTVPQNSDVVKQSASTLCANDDILRMRMTSVTDRISFLKVLVGIPMWGYLGTRQYEQKFKPAPGRHLYQTSVDEQFKNSRDWDLLPSPIPCSKVDEAYNPNIFHSGEEISEVFDEALKADIVIKTATGYVIQTISKDFMLNFIGKFNEAEGKTNVIKKSIQNNLKNINSNRNYDKHTYSLSDIPPSGKLSVDKVICLDFLIKAPLLVKIVQTELEKSHQIESMIANLEPDQDLTNFGQALFTGTIELEKLPNVCYISNNSGKSTTLSDLNKRYGAIPLYQAFLTFKKLDSSLQTEILSEVNDILKETALDKRVTEACHTAKMELDQRTERIKAADMLFPEKTSDINNFFISLSGELNSFAASRWIKL